MYNTQGDVTVSDFSISQRFSWGETVALLSSIIMFFAMFRWSWLPPADGSVLSMTGKDWLVHASTQAPGALANVMTAGGVTTLVFLALAAVVGTILALAGLLLPSTRQVMTILLVATGCIGMLFYAVFFYNALERAIRDAGSLTALGAWMSQFFDILAVMRFGFWIGFLACLGLIVQTFIPRPIVPVTQTEERFVNNSLRILVIVLALIFSLFPVVFVVSSAFNPTGALSTQGLIPKAVDSFDDLTVNFRSLLFDEASLSLFPFWNWLANSFFVASVSTILIVFITAMSAYSFSRFRFQGRRTMLLGILLIQVFPNLLAMVALFLILQQIGQLSDVIPQAVPFLSFIDWSWLRLFGLNSLGGLILVYLAGAMGINTWLMKGFFDSIPRDIDESALVDGASHWQIFWTLILPLVRPILAVIGVISFVGTFNEFVLARVLLKEKEKWTLMVGLFNFVDADFNKDWGKFAAGSLVSALPVVAIYIALQDQIVGGLTAGAVKG